MLSPARPGALRSMLGSISPRRLFQASAPQAHDPLARFETNVERLEHATRQLSTRERPRLALLIDADNTSWRSLGLIMNEAAMFGVAIVRRVFGDFTRDDLSPWVKPMAEHSFSPIQQFANSPGKNSTDIKMIIDTMDLLHSRSQRFDVFCLVTSDADFTCLAKRIREEGRDVIGMGYEQTPRAFIAACTSFSRIDALERVATPVKDRAPNQAKSAQDPASQPPLPSDVLSPGETELQVLDAVISQVADDDGWSQVCEVGQLIREIDPGFDPRNHVVAKDQNLKPQHLNRLESLSF